MCIRDRPTKINDGNYFSPKIDHAFNKWGCLGNFGDFHGSNDFLNLQDIDSEFFITNTECDKLHKFYILSLLSFFHGLSPEQQLGSAWEKSGSGHTVSGATLVTALAFFKLFAVIKLCKSCAK
eukprot:TRINITY_DN18376_c0_g2_i1.p2 TRINITY_DN18376_c0_g2~~TRINITY_DN18376_c0_g2_i1.p2  ORF type:complete len:142 (+),score=1.51 TRINITY_DN18376_c0_g2_i1:60-428(+)